MQLLFLSSSERTDRQTDERTGKKHNAAYRSGAKQHKTTTTTFKLLSVKYQKMLSITETSRKLFSIKLSTSGQVAHN